MPCMKCANGKWKYGEHGNCVFDTLAACKASAAAIHINIPSGPHQAPQAPQTQNSYFTEDMTTEMINQYK